MLQADNSSAAASYPSAAAWSPAFAATGCTCCSSQPWFLSPTRGLLDTQHCQHYCSRNWSLLQPAVNQVARLRLIAWQLFSVSCPMLCAAVTQRSAHPGRRQSPGQSSSQVTQSCCAGIPVLSSTPSCGGPLLLLLARCCGN